MVDIWKYAGRGSVQVNLTDTYGKIYTGTVENVEDAGENEEKEDGIVIYSKGKLIFFTASEVLKIEEINSVDQPTIS